MTATTIQVRPYELVQAPLAVALWNRAVGEAFPLREALWRQLVELNPYRRADDGVAAWRGERLIGFGLLGCYRGNAEPAAVLRGWAAVTAVVVDPEEQRRGLGSTLVEWLLRRADVPRERVRAGGGVFFLVPGPPVELPAAHAFFDALGLAFGRTVHDVRVDLASPQANRVADAAAQLRSRGMGTHPCRPEHVPSLLAFLAEEFPGGWWHDAEWFFANGGDPADWLLLREGDHVLGMARTHHPAARPIGAANYWSPLRGSGAGGLGPIGVAANRRGEGLGKLLLAATLQRLRVLGVDDAVADWTDVLGFYEPFGFRIWKSYVAGR